VDAACLFVQAKARPSSRGSKRRAYLCFDEWNVWYKNRKMDGAGKFAPHLIEEVYNLEDALVVAGFLNSFIRHADVVKIANLAQIVNVIAPILTRGDDLLIQSIYYPIEMVSQRREGISLRPVVAGPAYEGRTNGRVHVVDASAILAADKIHLFAVNRGLDEPAKVKVQVSDRDIATLDSGELLTGPGPKAANSFEQPNLIKSKTFEEARVAAGQAEVELPPLSVAAMTFRLG
jgi:alpha-N-arabinofuranosidase